MKFEEIPQNIRNSLSSERVNGILEDIRQKACISSPNLIARTFYNLITKETPAHYFIESLADVGIGGKIAASVAKAIKERILESERYPLFRWGIDISEIRVNDAEDVEHLGLKEDLGEEEEKKVPLESFEESEVETIPIIKSSKMPETPKETEGGEKETTSPFILQEKPKEERAPAGIGTRSIPSLSFGFFKPKRSPEPVPSKTIKAEVQAPAETKRVVHYTENRSTLSPFEQGGEFLKTEEIAPPIVNTIAKGELKATEMAMTPKPAEEAKKGGGPMVEGNTIDLRNQS